MPLVYCEINFILTWFATFLITGTVVNQMPSSGITGTKLYVPIVTLSNEDNLKPHEQLNSGFTRTINWSEYQSKVKTQKQDLIKVLRFKTDPSFKGKNRLFVLSY